MRAVVLGGTGAIGGAVAARLAAGGWSVDVTGRDLASMPPELALAGVRFHAVERSDTSAIGRLVDDGADLLVDLVAYRAADVRALLPVMGSVTSAVLVSSRAVYVDTRGRHVNSNHPPWFQCPIREDVPTVSPAGDEIDPFTREGYAPSKVAAERVALDSGRPVTIIRPSKVHGRWARQSRTQSFVECMLRGDRAIKLADGGSVDHLTAAVNTAALIEVVAGKPGQRILNSADPDTPTAEQIVRTIAERLAWSGAVELLHGQPESTDGDHPWRAAHPMVLDTAASERLGYSPQGRALELLAQEIDWIAERISGG